MRNIIVILVSLLLALGCAKKDKAVAQEEPPVPPLHPGMTWEQLNQFVTQTGARPSEALPTSAKMPKSLGYVQENAFWVVKALGNEQIIRHLMVINGNSLFNTSDGLSELGDYHQAVLRYYHSDQDIPWIRNLEFNGEESVLSPIHFGKQEGLLLTTRREIGMNSTAVIELSDLTLAQIQEQSYHLIVLMAQKRSSEADAILAEPGTSPLWNLWRNDYKEYRGGRLQLPEKYQKEITNGQ
jgi:hypothetical protein